MKELLLLFTLGCISGSTISYWYGYNESKDELPSCLYIMRPRCNNVKPLGYDRNEGVDWYCDDIEEGGIYVSLQRWKQNN